MSERSEVGRMLWTNREIAFRVPCSVFRVARDVSCDAVGAKCASGAGACSGSVCCCWCCCSPLPGWCPSSVPFMFLHVLFIFFIRHFLIFQCFTFVFRCSSFVVHVFPYFRFSIIFHFFPLPCTFESQPWLQASVSQPTCQPSGWSSRQCPRSSRASIISDASTVVARSLRFVSELSFFKGKFIG